MADRNTDKIKPEMEMGQILVSCIIVLIWRMGAILIEKLLRPKNIIQKLSGFHSLIINGGDKNSHMDITCLKEY